MSILVNRSGVRLIVFFTGTENDLDDALRKGDFDDIDQKVTPKTLARCRTNTLLKSFQVGLVILSLPILPVYFT